MTQRDCTAADVDLLLVDAEFFDDGQRLRRERLVQLEQVDVRHGPAGDRQLQGIKKSSLVWNVSQTLMYSLPPTPSETAKILTAFLTAGTGPVPITILEGILLA